MHELERSSCDLDMHELERSSCDLDMHELERSSCDLDMHELERGNMSFLVTQTCIVAPAAIYRVWHIVSGRSRGNM